MSADRNRPSNPRKSRWWLAGDTPLGLYWGMPVIVALAAAGLVVSLLMKGGHYHALVARAAWVLVFIGSIWQCVRQLRWDHEHHRRRLAALESVIQVSSLVGSETSSEAELIQGLPETVRTMLGMKTSVIGVLEDGGKTFHVMASAGMEPSVANKRFAMDDLPMTRACVANKYVIAVADATRNSAPVNVELAKRLNFRAMMQIPVLQGGEVTCVMIIADERPRHFTEIDIRRAWLWGCQASVMLTNARLYAEMNRTLKEQGRLLEHRDALYTLDTAIQRAGTLEEALQLLVTLAPGPLEVDLALIWIVNDDDPENMNIMAATSPYGEKVAGFRLALNSAMAQIVLGARQTVVVDNGFIDKRLNANLREVLPHGSLIFQPLLHGDQRPLGMLVLIRKETGPFHPDQIELSRLFSMRASAAIEMTRLYQQSLRDTDAKAMLLRELNHRVKNNLASIVSLLSVNQPKLPPDAQRWLNRAIERISAMAQVHEMFSGRSGRVTLAELVEQTVRSLSVSKPPGVQVCTDLQAGPARLRTDRAVSLAMAVHELCFNGIVHGLGTNGVLKIRARREDGHLTIEVEDDRGQSTPTPVAALVSGTGIGLSLVRGLVGRELRGQFNLASSSGGAMASVRFPLLADELSEAEL